MEWIVGNIARLVGVVCALLYVTGVLGAAVDPVVLSASVGGALYGALARSLSAPGELVPTALLVAVPYSLVVRLPPKWWTAKDAAAPGAPGAAASTR